MECVVCAKKIEQKDGRWWFCRACFIEWSKRSDVGPLSRSLPIERAPEFRLILRVAGLLGVNVFDAIARECHRAQGDLEILMEDTRKLRAMGVGYQYRPGKKTPLMRKLEKVDRATNRAVAENQKNAPGPRPQGTTTGAHRQARYRARKRSSAAKA